MHFSKEPGSGNRYRLVTGWMTERSEFESHYVQEFSFLHVVHTGFEVHPASYPMCTGGSFSRGKPVGT
jgi:hypothetical protein